MHVTEIKSAVLYIMDKIELGVADYSLRGTVYSLLVTSLFCTIYRNSYDLVMSLLQGRH